MSKLNIAGLKIDAITKADLLEQLRVRAINSQKTFITTPYSEFLYACLNNNRLLTVLNSADFAVPDGIGLFWAARFLSLPLTAKTFWGKIAQAHWQVFYTLCAILFSPLYIKKMFPEKISGADLVWNLAELAADNNFSVYLLGGFGNTPELASKRLSVRINRGRERNTPANLLIAGWSAKNPSDPSVIDDIKKAAPDFLFVAYGPLKQEQWIAENLPNLPVKLAIGLGGTFDYLAGKVPNPPKFLRQAGLEWLWRLFTQPHRAGRIYNAFFGLISAVIRYKIFISLPYRPNVASLIMNKKNEVLIARFNPDKKALQAIGYSRRHMQNFWQFPQGGIETGETIEQAARRELLEETGIQKAELIKISESTHSYNWPDVGKRSLFVKKRYQWKGQEQKIAYFKFSGLDSEIKLDHDELLEFKWVPLAGLDRLVHPDKAAVAKIAQQELKEMLEKAII